MEKAGREKRRKKQAVRHVTFIFTFSPHFEPLQVRRMEQIIRSHNASEEPEGMQTLDRDRESEGGDGRSREEGRRRQHKRSILKQEGRRGKDETSLLHETSSVRTKGGNKEAKVKFAGSLQRRGGRNGERNRRLVVRGPTYLLQLPWGYQPVSQPHHLYELQLHQRL